MYCKVYKFLAYAMSVYAIASIFYYIRTRSIGTPFNDSLSEKQLEIKKTSSKARKDIFIQGIVLGTASIYFLQPFNTC